MKIDLELFKATRENTIKVINELTLDQINKIPKGFTGNIAWHLGHMVATHRGLVYQLNGAPGAFEKAFVLKYKKDSVPEAPIDQKEFEFITEQLLNQIDELEEDLKNDELWGESTREYTTSYNYTIRTREEAIRFSNLHQVLHLGYIMALKRTVLAN